MKVLHLTTHLNTGGITVYIQSLINPLRKAGIETFIVSSGGECSEKIVSEGARVFELPIRTKNWLHPKILLAVPHILKIIRREHIDILHAHTRVTQVLAFYAQRLTGIPIVTTCHGFYKRNLGRRIFPAWGDYAVAISPLVAESLERDFKLPAARIRTVNNGVDVEAIEKAYARHNRAEVKKSLGFSEADFVLGNVARLVLDKGHDYLIRAVKILLPDFPHLKLLIVGDGRQREVLEVLVRELGLSQSVVFTGNVADVPRMLAAIDIFAFPAVWREGFGLSIAEAMACSKPIIVSNIWALNQLIKHEQLGILVPPKNETALAQAIADLIRSPLKRKEFGDNARRAVHTHFSIERMTTELKAVYEEALKKRLTASGPPL